MNAHPSLTSARVARASRTSGSSISSAPSAARLARPPSRGTAVLAGCAALVSAQLLAALLAPAPAEAAAWRVCNGAPVIWRGGTTLHRNRCSIADSGVTNTAYWNGVDAWNRMTGTITSFLVNPVSDCSVDHDDDQNEVALVDRSTIDGNNGLTVLQLGVCFIGSNDIDEADVMIANDLGFTPVWGDFIGTTGRSTFVHELGHFFGFTHEDTHAVMRTSPPHLVTGGLEPSTVWPADTSGLGAVYGVTNARPNLLPSALGPVGGVVQTLDPRINFPMCRGGSRTARFTLANSGSVASGTYGIRIRLSTAAPMAGYSAASTVVASFSHSLGAFSSGTYDLSFTVPSTLANGTYYLYVDVDPAGAVPELLEGDNSTVSAMRIVVNC